MEVIQNQEGGTTLLHEGYMYTKKTVNKTTIRWECSQSHAKICKGAITTGSQIQRVGRRTTHRHDPNIIAVSATKACIELKAAACITQSSPGQLLGGQALELSVEVCAATGATDNIKNALCHEKALGLSSNPTSLESDTVEWMLVFASESGL